MCVGGGGLVASGYSLGSDLMWLNSTLTLNALHEQSGIVGPRCEVGTRTVNQLVLFQGTLAAKVLFWCTDDELMDSLTDDDDDKRIIRGTTVPHPGSPAPEDQARFFIFLPNKRSKLVKLYK